MRKIAFLFFITNLSFLPAHSQAVHELGVDTVKIVCLYEQVNVPDTLKPQKKVNNLMLLQIGNRCSRYYSFYKYLTDSVSYMLARKSSEMGQMFSGQEAVDEYQKISVKRIPSELNYVIFKNYPKNGLLSLYDRFGYDSFVCEEPLPAMQWQLSNDTLTVCSYLCKKATSTFRGRNYTVWYTREIPVSDGPWKFSGLPGLILKAVDDQEYFSFECTAIEISKEIKQIINSSGQNRKISRMEYNKAKQRFMDNPGAYMSGHPIREASSPFPASAYKQRPYNPMERFDE